MGLLEPKNAEERGNTDTLYMTPEDIIQFLLKDGKYLIDAEPRQKYWSISFFLAWKTFFLRL